MSERSRNDSEDESGPARSVEAVVRQEPRLPVGPDAPRETAALTSVSETSAPATLRDAAWALMNV